MPLKRNRRPRRVIVLPTVQIPESPELEFCAPGDDAWYSVQIQLEGETLRVSYRGFPETDDVCFPANGFDTVEAIEKLRGRFRAESVQLQDEQCAEVVKGTVVCASNKYGESDLKFYDAVVDSEMTPMTSVGHTLGGKIHNCQNGAQDISFGSSTERNTNAPECHYFFRVSNLEKDISPVCIMDFIHEQTAVSSVAFVFPTSPAESYATGTIFVETKEEADKLSAFLLNQTHVIMSLRSRPWETNARWRGAVKGKMPKFEEYFSKGGREDIGKLNLVTIETKEYVMAKELQKLHNKFHEYIEPLHDSLEIEEKAIASRFPPPGTTWLPQKLAVRDFELKC